MRTSRQRFITVCAVAFAIFHPAAARSDFSYGDFNSTQQLNLVGSAAQSGPALRLTPSQNSLKGAAWFADRQRVVAGFSTTFSFRISELRGTGADGFAFVIQNTSATAIGIGGGFAMAYDIPKSLAVEFDTYGNGETSDPNGNHISIQTAGSGTNSGFPSSTLVSTGTTPLPNMSDGAEHTVKIEYADGVLKVYLDDLATPRVTTAYDLGNIGLESGAAWVGFTASTGGEAENHDITSWSFTSASPIWLAGRDLAVNEKPDAPKETNATNESAPAWRYGYRSSAATTNFTPFTPAQHSNAAGGNYDDLEGFEVPENGMTVAVNVAALPVVRNLGPGNQNQIFSQQLLLTPSAANDFPVVRWVAPASGSYRILAKWIDLDPYGGNGASGHVTINGTEVFGRKIPADAVGPERFVGQEWDNGGEAAMPATTFKLNAGDVVDFALGSRGDPSFDATAFNAAIRRVLAVTIPNAQPESFTVEGADLDIPVELESELPVTGVALMLDGETVAQDLTAPYNLTYANIASGTHYLTVVARDEAGIESASERLKLTVLKNTGTSAASAAAGGGKDGAGTREVSAAVGSGKTYFCRQSGAWSNPATWGGEGVPGENDDAVIAAGFTVNVERVNVLNLEASGTIVLGNPELPGTLTVRGLLQANGEIAGANTDSQVIVFNRLGCLAAQAFFRDLTLIVSGAVVVTGDGGIRSANCIILTSGATNLFSTPGTNRGIVAAFDEVDLSGGRLALDPYAIFVGRAGIVSRDSAGIVSRDSAGIVAAGAGNIVAAGAGNLIGPDGATLIGPDGATLISNNPKAAIVAAGAGNIVGNSGTGIVAAGAGNILVNNGGNLKAQAVQTPSSATAQGVSGEHRAEAAEASTDLLLERSTLSGSLQIFGSVTNRNGFVLPGNPVDAIRISGDYTQEAGGTLVLDVGGAGAGQSDQLQIGGVARLDGKLIVKTLNGFTPQSGDTFAPLTYESLSGGFASISSNAQVSVGPNGITMQVSGPNPPAPKALNISTRMRVESDDNALIAGFIITGSQPKKVLVRGIGPSLPVSGALADPVLSLDNGAVVNDDWKSTQEQAIRDTTIPPASELESAIVATLDPGPHTAILRGKNNGTGVGLVEVYDLESGTPVQLANISTRGLVQAGDNVMIGGFIIGGDYPAKVLLRAIGPSLSVTGKLEDPTLELVDANGGRITNDNWRATQEAEIIATTVPPTHDNESAIVVTLVPGFYTAIVRGKDDTAGVGLVEGYNLQ